MKTLKFIKVHGLGNDFMVIDGINQTFKPRETSLSVWSDRFKGVGFDQLLLMKRPSSELVDFRYRIFDADGGEVGQCGNGTHCFVRFATSKGLTDKEEILVETAGGVIVPRLLENGLVTVSMSQSRFMPSEMPFVPDSREDSDALTHIILVGLESMPASCVSMGNPHAMIIMENMETAPVGRWGEAIEPHGQFPERVNVGSMQIISRREVRLCIYGRGAGETQVYGTGMCVAVVAGIHLGLLDAGGSVKVMLPGGDLSISWTPEGGVMVAGPAETVFKGELQY